MKTDNISQLRAERVYLDPDRVWLDDLAALAHTETVLEDYPFAAEVASRVLLYDCDAVRRVVRAPDGRRGLLAEWAEALMTGPGIIVLRRAFADLTPVDAASDIFRTIIAEQRMTGSGTRSKNCACARRRSSRPITATRSSPWWPRPGSDPPTSSPPRSMW
jgi:hypothetical protein